MRRFAAFAIAGALALSVAPAVASAGTAPALRHVAPPFVHAGVVFAPPPIPVPRFEVVITRNPEDDTADAHMIILLCASPYGPR